MDATPANPHATRGENERKVFMRDRTPHIFRPIAFRSVHVRNRIIMSPMLHAAKALRAKIAWPAQYERGDIY